MHRSHTCGQLRLSDVNTTVTLCGWVQRIRDKGAVIWVDLRDRYGITQLMIEEKSSPPEVVTAVRSLGREYVIAATGTVIERFSKNDKMETGDIEIKTTGLQVLNAAKLPPFMIEDDTDGGDELRMQYRYLDLRRSPVRKSLELRHRLAQEVRRYLDEQSFLEVETPVLIKSTPEGARDFVVPSRMNPGEFYALPQSPQTFKQLLMVSGFDRYFQIVKCFRDEDLRADRQPEFTQIDCEMAFVEQEDILNTFEGLIRHLFRKAKNIELPAEIKRMPYSEAMRLYGSDKPDIRFGMEFVELNELVQNKGFQVFDAAELVVGICATGCAEYTRKQLDELTDFVKRPQVGAKGLVWARYGADGTLKSSVDKFYDESELKKWAEKFNAKPGDLMLIISGEADKARKQLSELRLKLRFCDLISAKNSVIPLYVKNNTYIKNYNINLFGGDFISLAFKINAATFTNTGEFEKFIDSFKNENISGIFYNGDKGSPWKRGNNLSPTELNSIIEFIKPNANECILLIEGRFEDVHVTLNNLAKQYKEIDEFVNSNQCFNKTTPFSVHWVVDFPLLEWDEESGRYHAMHHPFTSPKPEDFDLIQTDPGKVRANAYDMVINGVEVGGGSIRIHDRELQSQMFTLLGFSLEEAKKQFGFLMEAFEFGAPPHGGIAFGFDRLCSLFGGSDSIRDYIAFPKNNSGRDVMIDSPSTISEVQLKELAIKVDLK